MIKDVTSASKLHFTDEEMAKLDTEFKGILAFIEQGGATGEHMAIGKMVLGLEDLADDVPGPTMPIEDVLMNAPRKRGRYFVVPQAVD